MSSMDFVDYPGSLKWTCRQFSLIDIAGTLMTTFGAQEMCIVNSF